MSVILIASAAASNFEGMDAMVGQDGLVYLGKRENYHASDGEGAPAYAKPLTDRQQYDYELRPSRDNPDVRVKMRRQAQVVGPWEEYHSIPEEQRETEYDHARGLYRPRQSVSPERLKTRYISVKMSPVPNWHTPKRKDTPRHGAR